MAKRNRICYNGGGFAGAGRIGVGDWESIMEKMRQVKTVREMIHDLLISIIILISFIYILVFVIRIKCMCTIGHVYAYYSRGYEFESPIYIILLLKKYPKRHNFDSYIQAYTA